MNPTQTLHAAFAHYPNAIATICGERQQNWTELRNRVERLAGALVSQGVAAGDRVAGGQAGTGRPRDASGRYNP